MHVGAALINNQNGRESAFFQSTGDDLSTKADSVKMGKVQKPKAQSNIRETSELEMLKTIQKRDLRIEGIIGGKERQINYFI